VQLLPIESVNLYPKGSGKSRIASYLRKRLSHPFHPLLTSTRAKVIESELELQARDIIFSKLQGSL